MAIDRDLDAFLAECDDVITDWDGGADSASWSADGSHQPAELDGDYYAYDRPGSAPSVGAGSLASSPDAAAILDYLLGATDEMPRLRSMPERHLHWEMRRNPGRIRGQELYGQWTDELYGQWAYEVDEFPPLPRIRESAECPVTVPVGRADEVIYTAGQTDVSEIEFHTRVVPERMAPLYRSGALDMAIRAQLHYQMAVYPDGLQRLIITNG